MGWVKNIMFDAGHKWKMYQEFFEEKKEEQRKVLRDIKAKSAKK